MLAIGCAQDGREKPEAGGSGCESQTLEGGCCGSYFGGEEQDFKRARKRYSLYIIRTVNMPYVYRAPYCTSPVNLITSVLNKTSDDKKSTSFTMPVFFVTTHHV